jgi:hypothetical protein
MGIASELPVLASTAGDLALAAFVIVLLAAVIFVFYSRRGSDVAQRPVGREKGKQPGVAEGPSRMSASEHDAEESGEKRR